MLWVAPNPPAWVYAAGVPRIIMPERLPDAVWDHRLAGGADMSLRHVGGADTVFHLIEIERL